MAAASPAQDPIQLDSIDDAIRALAAGKLVLVVDDADRENEGDLVGTASLITPEWINFMAKHGRGLICTPLPDSYCERLDLHPMVQHNTDPHHTAFTVSIDLRGHGVTTGISASDRAETIRALVDPSFGPDDFNRPGHIFPLRAKPGGVLQRTGHTEAAVDLTRLAGLPPVGVIVEVMNEDGTMARLPQLVQMARKWDLPLVSIADLVAYRMAKESLVRETYRTSVTTVAGTFEAIVFQQQDGLEHLAFTFGHWDSEDEVLVRMQTGGALADAVDWIQHRPEEKLHQAFAAIAKAGAGAVVCMNTPGSGSSMVEKLKNLQHIRPSFGGDPRDYGMGAQILRALGVRRVNLLTSQPMKRVGIEGYGLTIARNTLFTSPSSDA